MSRQKNNTRMQIYIIMIIITMTLLLCLVKKYNPIHIATVFQIAALKFASESSSEYILNIGNREDILVYKIKIIL
jgi:hypothetical protein